MRPIIIHQKIRIYPTKEQQSLLNKQSKLCIKLYNLILESCYHSKRIFKYDNKVNMSFIFNEYTRIKNEKPYFNIIHRDTAEHILFRLKKEIEGQYRKTKTLPNYKQSMNKFFSLYYKNKSLKNNIKNKKINIPLGTYLSNNTKKNLSMKTTLSCKINLRTDGKVLIYEITKMYNYYYLIACIKYSKINRLPKTGNTVSIDPNHTNFFVCIDNNGKSIEFDNLYQLKYFDKRIDELRSKREKCRKDSKTYKTRSKTDIYVPSKRYKELSVQLLQIFHNRNEQINTALYTIAKYLVEKYDVIAIGDYTVSQNKIPYREMRRKMINQSVISKFRKILEYVCERSGKKYILVNEYNTTKKCFYCNNMERKNPTIRTHVCPKCKKEIYRDINSAINIGIKAKILSSQDYEDLDLSKPSYTAKYDLRKQKIIFCD